MGWLCGVALVEKCLVNFSMRTSGPSGGRVSGQGWLEATQDARSEEGKRRSARTRERRWGCSVSSREPSASGPHTPGRAGRENRTPRGRLRDDHSPSENQPADADETSSSGLVVLSDNPSTTARV